TVVDAFYTILGIEAIQEDVSVALKHKTPSVNAETARFLVRAFSNNKKLLKAYVNSLLEKLSVSDPSALGVLLKFLGESNILKHMPDLDNIKLEKIKEFAGKAELTGKTAAQLQAAPPPKAKVVKPKAGGPRIVTAPESEEDLAPLPKKAPAGKKVPAGKKAPGKARKPEEGKKAAPSAAKSRFGMVATAASNKKKSNEDEGGSSAPYVCASLKNTRFKEEAKFKVLKWNFSTPRPEFVEQLQDQMTNANFNKALLAQMFHNDFKQHIKVIDALLKYLPKDMDALKDNLDLILKWLTLRFFETSPSVLMKGLDYLKSVFKLLAEDSYVLHEIEATSFIPLIRSDSVIGLYCKRRDLWVKEAQRTWRVLDSRVTHLVVIFDQPLAAPPSNFLR
ncbi:Cytoskeleton associated protein 5, partial [Caligus rogercresseyi]